MNMARKSFRNHAPQHGLYTQTSLENFTALMCSQSGRWMVYIIDSHIKGN